jgi:hypothetical protein
MEGPKLDSRSRPSRPLIGTDWSRDDFAMTADDFSILFSLKKKKKSGKKHFIVSTKKLVVGGYDTIYRIAVP